MMVVRRAALAATACTLTKQDAPPLAGPSEFGLSLSFTATPDQLAREMRGELGLWRTGLLRLPAL